MSRQAMRTAFRIFLVTVLVGVAGGSYVVWRVARFPDTATGTARGPVDVEIPRGAGAGQVAERLHAAGLLEQPTLFRLYAGQRGVASKFKPGHYRIEAPATPRQLLDLMVKGVADELVAVTLPEGRNVAEAAELFDAGGVVPKADFMAKALDPAFARELGLPGGSLEGYLFPDTYRMRPQTPAAKVLTAMVRRHRQVYDELAQRHATGVARLAGKLGIQPAEIDTKIVILASIVEKETGQPHERPRIAQVFINRMTLQSFKPRLLQTDPTIIYGCTIGPLVLGKISEACKQFDGRIRRIHLDDGDNPYSTYAHEGLPPGPISNPGRAALEAVMQPDGSSYLYFVSRNDGTHHFSATRSEHEAAVVKYQRGGRPLSSSAPN